MHQELFPQAFQISPFFVKLFMNGNKPNRRKPTVQLTAIKQAITGRPPHRFYVGHFTAAQYSKKRDPVTVFLPERSFFALNGRGCSVEKTEEIWY